MTAANPARPAALAAYTEGGVSVQAHAREMFVHPLLREATFETQWRHALEDAGVEDWLAFHTTQDALRAARELRLMDNYLAEWLRERRARQHRAAVYARLEEAADA